MALSPDEPSQALGFSTWTCEPGWGGSIQPKRDGEGLTAEGAVGWGGGVDSEGVSSCAL